MTLRDIIIEIIEECQMTPEAAQALLMRILEELGEIQPVEGG